MSDYDDDPPITLYILIILGILVLLGLSAWGIRACTVAQDATLGRAEEKVRSQNFEESEAYRQGLRHDFDDLLLAYKRAKSDDERDAVLSVMRHRAAEAPPDLVPPEVKQLINEKIK
jgi:hypothetical protein